MYLEQRELTSEALLELAAARLARNLVVIEQLSTDVTADQATWRPNGQAWSILEVICHLADEEREDFRQRTELLLRDPERDWPAIDPSGWPASRNYQGRDLVSAVADFKAERERSLSWLYDLVQPDLSRRKQSPSGVISAGDLLSSWVAHDYLHIRQLTQLHYRYWDERTGSYRLAYAGKW